MLYPELVELENKMLECREAAKINTSSACCDIVKYKSAKGDDIGLLIPSPNDINQPIDILFVGINPHYSDKNGSTETNPKKDNGKLYHGYLDSITCDLKTTASIGYTNIVPCGTDKGHEVTKIREECRNHFFDKLIEILHPKLIIAVGQYASESLYWKNVYSENNQISWSGIKKHHSSFESANFGKHKCNVLFILQPSSFGLTTEKKEMARIAANDAYKDALQLG